MFGTKKASSTTAAKKAAVKTFDTAAAEKFFGSYADEEDPEIISMEGIAKICESMEIDPSSDVRCLVMMWKLGANAKPGQISKEEFVKGCEKLNVTDANGLKALLPTFDPGFLDRQEFRGK